LEPTAILVDLIGVERAERLARYLFKEGS